MNSDSRIKNIEQAKLLIKAQQLEKLEKEKAEKLKAELAQQQKTEDLFLAAVKNARPLNTNRIHHEPSKPKPIPQQFIRDEKQALRDSLSDGYIPAYELESGEELLYLREGQSPSVLSKLRRGHWVIQANLDLHGLISDEARIQVGEFLAGCKKRGIRCVRIVHGKGLGSRNREPILKHKVRNWLIQKDEVIAYAQARATDGGSGAVIVLLKA
ncbi:MAG: Smr/MutS family protein [Candidatus Methylopumilus sp.]|jgi:DNA-nicking Smr family endonuclease|nr:Smr/MutS family protein [Candidatus Methylopumilus sp.]